MKKFLEDLVEKFGTNKELYFIYLESDKLNAEIVLSLEEKNIFEKVFETNLTDEMKKVMDTEEEYIVYKVNLDNYEENKV